jgi:hypothetical protein
MDELEQAVELALKKIFGGMQVKQILTGIARNVDELTCEVERDGSPTLLNVRLNAIDDNLESFFTVYPAEGSAVLVAIIENMKTEAVVIKCSEVSAVKMKIGDMTYLANKDGFVFNAGENGGLLNINKMVDWMKDVKADMTALKALLKTSPVAGNGAPLNLMFNPKTADPDIDELEDTTIKH